MEITSETKEIGTFQKISMDISLFQEHFKALVIDGEKDILNAKSLQKQVKAIKSLAKSSTEVEWKTKKTAYEESRDETEKKKKEYYEIRDKRNILMNACTDIFNGIKKKIEDFRTECVRKAEIEKARIAKELKEKEEMERIERERIKAEEQRKIDEADEMIARKQAEEDELCREAIKQEQLKAETIQKVNMTEFTPNQDGMKIISETGVTISTECLIHGKYEGEECPGCINENKPDNKPLQSTSKTMELNATIPPQKSEEGQNEPIVNEIEIEVININQLIGSIMRGERGATFDLIQPNTEELIKLAKKFNCKPGDTIITGCRVKG
jgi:hypothetical protein